MSTFRTGMGDCLSFWLGLTLIMVKFNCPNISGYGSMVGAGEGRDKVPNGAID